MVCIQFLVKTKIGKNLESEGEGASLEIFNLLPLHTNSFYHLGAGSTCHNYDQFHLLSITFHNSNQSTSASLCTLSVQQINTFLISSGYYLKCVININIKIKINPKVNINIQLTSVHFCSV